MLRLQATQLPRHLAGGVQRALGLAGRLAGLLIRLAVQPRRLLGLIARSVDPHDGPVGFRLHVLRRLLDAPAQFTRLLPRPPRLLLRLPGRPRALRKLVADALEIHRHFLGDALDGGPGTGAPAFVAVPPLRTREALGALRALIDSGAVFLGEAIVVYLR